MHEASRQKRGKACLLALQDDTPHGRVGVGLALRAPRQVEGMAHVPPVLLSDRAGDHRVVPGLATEGQLTGEASCCCACWAEGMKAHCHLERWISMQLVLRHHWNAEDVTAHSNSSQGSAREQVVCFGSQPLAI